MSFKSPKNRTLTSTLYTLQCEAVVSVEQMDELLASIAAGKERVDAMRPVSRASLRSLKSYDMGLTYTSNAIEGNTLTPRETAEVIERIVFRSQPEISRADSTLPSGIPGSPVIFPNAMKIRPRRSL